MVCDIPSELSFFSIRHRPTTEHFFLYSNQKNDEFLPRARCGFKKINIVLRFRILFDYTVADISQNSGKYIYPVEVFLEVYVYLSFFTSIVGNEDNFHKSCIWKTSTSLQGKVLNF